MKIYALLFFILFERATASEITPFKYADAPNQIYDIPASSKFTCARAVSDINII